MLKCYDLSPPWIKNRAFHLGCKEMKNRNVRCIREKKKANIITRKERDKERTKEWGTSAHVRKRFYSANMKDLFENVNIDEILSFLRETKLYEKNKYKPDQYHTK